MFVVALTGGIGSGKSTVANIFAEKGVTIIDTDQLAREVTQKNTPTLEKITEHFGQDILYDDGTLNRASLRQKIFKNDAERIFLENLLHPLIRNETKKQAEQAKFPYCIVVIPLLFETKPNPLFNRVLVVDATLETQIQRAGLRDQETNESILAIVKSQVSREKRLQGADDIIINDGLLADLRPQVETLHEKYLVLAKL